MREILFRGYDGTNKKWVYGHYAKHALFHMHLILDLSTGVASGVLPSTIGQYTGLRDKNGKRIFEGDVVEWTGANTGREIDSVEFLDGGFTPFAEADTDFVPLAESVSVIGNIHNMGEEPTPTPGQAVLD